MPELSVIVCTYNRSKYLPDLLQSLKNQELDREIFELLIIDNNSTDETSDILKRFIKENPDIKAGYFPEQNPGLSHARNRGIKESRGKVLVFIDDDAVAIPGYLKEIAAYFNSNPDVPAGGGKIIPEYEKERPQWMTPYLLPVVSALDLGEKIRFFPSKKYPIGANMFFRREVFDQTGLFNPELGRKGSKLLGGEEKDIFLKLKPEPKIVYLPSAAVYHFVPETRLQMDYITKMASGVGYSEKVRAKTAGKTAAGIYLKELIKWFASILLYFIYLVKLEYPKGKMLLVFRYYVTKGMLTGKRND